MGIQYYLAVILWCGLGYLIYVEFGYIFLLFVIAKFKYQDSLKRTYQPSLTVLLAAHNEENVIRQKLENTLAQDCPPNLLQIIVASDSSTDRTDHIVQEYVSRGVLLCRTSEHVGKIASLRLAEPSINGQVVIFTDADSILQPGAISRLVSHFDEPQVGAVSGREIRPSSGSPGRGNGEGLYNRLETQVKRLESRIGNQVLLHGGFFAVRRELLPFVPDHLTHDAIIPLILTLKGYKVLYEPEAISVEDYALDSRQDWNRRIRTVMQAFQSYLYVKEALNPLRSGFYAVQIWSHRFFRWFVFPVLVIVLVSNLLLLGQSPIYQATAILQGVCYLFACLGFCLDRIGKRPAFFYVPFYFLYIHLAAFIAVILSWEGKKVATWQTARQ